MSKDIEDAIRSLKKKEQNANKQIESTEQDDEPDTGDNLLIPVLGMITLGLSGTYLVKKISTEIE